MDTNLERIQIVCVYPSKLKSVKKHFQVLELGSYGYTIRNSPGVALAM